MHFAGLIIAVSGIVLGLVLPDIWTESKTILSEIHPYLAQSIVGGLLITGGIVYFFESRKPSKIQKEICEKIFNELDDGLQSLNGKLDRKTFECEIDGKKIYYKHIYMNYQVYDGYINSGDFNKIDHIIQQPIQDIFGKIKIHNEYVKKIVASELDPCDNLDYVSILNETEKELLNDIPPIMLKLKNIFD